MAEQARNLEEKDDQSATITDEGQLVVFRLANEEFGVGIDNVKEIVRMPDITPMPRSPLYVAGICNLRGSVLPVIDTRLRFSMPSGERSDHTRLLVVDISGEYIGLIVDAMREVMRMNDALVEPPPLVCQSVDSQFLEGVVKMNNGQRLVLMLNLKEVVDINVKGGTGAAVSRGEARLQQGQGETVEEEHLVSFNLAGEEYSFDIIKVREILKVPEITAVPNVPGYVKGLFTVRNQLLPIIDLRGLMGLPDLVSEHYAAIDIAVEEQKRLEDAVVNFVEGGKQLIGLTEPSKTFFGKWLDRYDTSSVEIERSIKQLKNCRDDFYHDVLEARRVGTQSKEHGLTQLEEHVQSLNKAVLGRVAELKQAINQHHTEDQRVMVAEAGGMYIGFLVDSVNEVMRISKSLVDEAPSMAASAKKEVKGVARLNDGERLVMIMDEQALISQETSKVLGKIKSEIAFSEQGNMASEEKSLGQQTLDEEQLVTFGIAEQEYGVQIMQVQEINRIGDITLVPRAPSFVDGVTNLRGNVIPVINVRTLFGLPSQEIDDRTRVIIVDIAGNKTGLRVDHVNEVLRLPKNEIEKTPSIVTATGDNEFIAGVCKIDNGKRMIALLDIGRILGEKEVEALKAINDQEATENQSQAVAREPQNDEPTEPMAETGIEEISSIEENA